MSPGPSLWMTTNLHNFTSQSIQPAQSSTALPIDEDGDSFKP